jgi:hypothetical protein
MVLPTLTPPHIIPFLRFIGGENLNAEKPGNEAAERMADAIAVFFVNCRLFIYL